MQIKVNCTTCGKDIFIDKWWYNYRLKRNNNRGIFCSPKCGRTGQPLSEETKDKLTVALRKSYDEGRRNLSPIVTIECLRCKKPLTMKRWEYNHRMNRNQRDGLFCSLECSSLDHKTSEETRRKLSQSQKGISVLTRGRPGHTVSEETKEKIRLKKLGNVNGQKHHIIIDKELSFRKTDKYAITKGLVPDAIFIDEDGKLVALEVEQKKWETDIRQKMKMYENRNDYDKVIIVWYSPEGERLKEWQKDNGEWKLVI